jgi:hypothetical protein
MRYGASRRIVPELLAQDRLPRLASSPSVAIRIDALRLAAECGGTEHAARYSHGLMPRLPSFVVAALVVTAGACIQSVDVPEPPDMQPLLSAYASPTATVGPTIMAAATTLILETERAIDETSLSEELLVLVEQLQEELDPPSDEEEVLDVNGAPVSDPTGVIRLNRVCSGWSDGSQARDPDVDGTIELTLTLHGGRIGPVVWGTFHACRWKRALGTESVRVEYDGEIRAHLGGSFGTHTALRRRVITFAVTGTAAVNDTPLALRRSFRVALAGARDILDGRLDVLLETEEGKYFVFFFRAADFTTGVQDATGRFFCSLEEHRCESPSGSFSW